MAINYELMVTVRVKDGDKPLRLARAGEFSVVIDVTNRCQTERATNSSGEADFTEIKGTPATLCQQWYSIDSREYEVKVTYMADNSKYTREFVTPTGG